MQIYDKKKIKKGYIFVFKQLNSSFVKQKIVNYKFKNDSKFLLWILYLIQVQTMNVVIFIKYQKETK